MRGTSNPIEGIRLLFAGYRNLYQLVGGRGHQRTPRLRLRLGPMIGPKYPQYSHFVASLEFRAPHAILPRFERQGSAFDHMKTYPVEKIYNIGESKDSV